MTPAIDYYCDPLNPWGWVLEPDRRRLAVAFPDVEWRTRPAGMVESWEAYEGPEIEGGRQGMPATCARLSERYGMPIDEFLWFDDPPSSSWPACRAISAAGLQGDALGLGAMRACREATFARRRSISDRDQLEGALADVTGLDLEALTAAIDDGRADDAFADHRSTAASVDAPGVRRVDGRVELPTLVVRDGESSRGVSGRSGYNAYRAAVTAVTGLEPEAPPGVAALLERFSPCGWVSAVELAVVTGDDEPAVVEAARELVEAGDAVEESFGAGPFFRLAEALEAGE